MLGSNPSAVSEASTVEGGCYGIPFLISDRVPSSGEAAKRQILGGRGQSPRSSHVIQHSLLSHNGNTRLYCDPEGRSRRRPQKGLLPNCGKRGKTNLSLRNLVGRQSRLVQLPRGVEQVVMGQLPAGVVQQRLERSSLVCEAALQCSCAQMQLSREIAMYTPAKDAISNTMPPAHNELDDVLLARIST